MPAESKDFRATVEKAVEVARAATRAASAAALKHFRDGVAVEKKADASPVTIADREAEAAMLAIVKEAFPAHAILGEETGGHAGDGAWRWILDPIDGTRGYTRGGPFWGPLVALEHHGEVVAGAFALPVLGESYYGGRDLGCHKDGVRVTVSSVPSLAEATICLGEPKAFATAQLPATLGVMRGAASTRCPGDLGGGAYVLSGRADAWLETGVQIWDIAPFQCLIEEAGGRFTDFAGKATIASGNCLASNGRVHDELLALLHTAR
jgi:histidinol-phosphatase